MRTQIFEGLPMTVITRRPIGCNVPDEAELRTVQSGGELILTMCYERWRPLLESCIDKFCCAKMIALVVDGYDYEPCEALRDFSPCAHVIAEVGSNDGAFIVAFPLHDMMKEEEDYFRLLSKVASVCRMTFTEEDLTKFLPCCGKVLSVNYRSKIDVNQLLAG